jgi:hypothetical protein
MPRVLRLGLCIVLLTGLAGCGGGGSLPEPGEEALRKYIAESFCSQETDECGEPQITKVDRQNVTKSSDVWEAAWCVELTLQKAGAEEDYHAVMVKWHTRGYDVIDMGLGTCKGITIE